MSPVSVLDVSGQYPSRGEKATQIDNLARSTPKVAFSPSQPHRDGEKVPQADEGRSRDRVSFVAELNLIKFVTIRCMIRRLLAALTIFAAACATTHPAHAVQDPADQRRLQDRGLEGGTVGGLARVRTLRKQLESRRHAGARAARRRRALSVGDEQVPRGASRWSTCMNLLDGDAAKFDPTLIVTFGNHEFDKSDAEDPAGAAERVAVPVGVDEHALVQSETCDQPFRARRVGLSDRCVDVGGTEGRDLRACSIR